METDPSTFVFIDSSSDSLQVLLISMSTTFKLSLAPLKTSLAGGRGVFLTSATGIFSKTSLAGRGGGFSRTSLDRGRGGTSLAGGRRGASSVGGRGGTLLAGGRRGASSVGGRGGTLLAGGGGGFLFLNSKSMQ